MSIAGHLVDLCWHAAHDEFETANDRPRAHWLAWLGALVLLATAVLALVRRRGGPAMIAVLLGAPGVRRCRRVARLREGHYRGPDAAHVVLTVTQVVMLVGALAAVMIVMMLLMCGTLLVGAL